MPDLVTTTADAYERMAINLGTHPEQLDGDQAQARRQPACNAAVRYRVFHQRHRKSLQHDVWAATGRAWRRMTSLSRAETGPSLPAINKARKQVPALDCGARLQPLLQEGD